jgi:hypothetical protein
MESPREIYNSLSLLIKGLVASLSEPSERTAAIEALWSDINSIIVRENPAKQMQAILALAHRVAGLAALEKPEYNEASLFDELKSIAKTICDFAYENKKHAGFFFDVVAKDGGIFRVNFSLLRHDAFPRPPLVVLEPRSKDHHLDSCHNCDINAKP